MHYIHDINPIAFELFGIPFPWYWLSYLFGFIAVIFYGRWLIINKGSPLKLIDFWQQLQWGWPMLFIGARSFYVLFYNFPFFRDHPHLIPQIWLGGMSFHGALIGIALSGYVVSRIQKSNFLSYTDIIVTAAPIGIFFGRISNFINGELAGHTTNVSWAVIFPRLYDDLPRHPSQLYEAFGEGIVLFFILYFTAKKFLHSPGVQSALFLIGYGIIRFFIEFFRLPDEQLGTFLSLSLGQYLCLLMVLAGTSIFYFNKTTYQKS